MSRWPSRHDLADHQPIVEHPDGGQMMLHRGCREFRLQPLRYRLPRGAGVPSPGRGSPDRRTRAQNPLPPSHRLSGVRVSDIDREELDDPLGRPRIWHKKRGQPTSTMLAQEPKYDIWLGYDSIRHFILT